MENVVFEDWGMMGYSEAWEKQEAVFGAMVANKIAVRNGAADLGLAHRLIFVEHTPVFTLGRNGNAQNLLLDKTALEAKGIDFFPINRGGDITYHGPGQLVSYPILDLDKFFTDIHKYLRYLEEAVILTLAEYDITAGRVDGLTGVWIAGGTPFERKICAMGIRCSRWVTMHGLSLNVNTDLSYFDDIVPCGITDKAVTSMQRELGEPIDMVGVKEKLRVNLAKVFGWEEIVSRK